MRSMPPDSPPADASADALRGRVVDLEGEVARLTLRVKDLQQQLWGRKAERGLATEPTVAVLSLFEDALAAAESDTAAGAPARASDARRSPAGARPGPKPRAPALPRELIVRPDPPAADRRCSVTGVALVPGFAERLEVLARRAPTYFVKRYARATSARSGLARRRRHPSRPRGRPTCSRAPACT